VITAARGIRRIDATIHVYLHCCIAPSLAAVQRDRLPRRAEERPMTLWMILAAVWALSTGGVVWLYRKADNN